MRVEPLPHGAHDSAKFDLALLLREVDGRIVGGMEYATALFDPPTVERYLGYLRTLLEGMTADPTVNVHRLPMLSAAEMRQVVQGWNATAADYPSALCVHELVEAQVARTPQAVAVMAEHGELTYADLNARANRLAHYLRKLGVGPDTRAALCLERTPELIVAVLAVLKAGGAYVPLDPAYPAARLAFMLADSAPAVLLTQAAMAGRFNGLGVPVRELVIDAPTTAWAEELATNPTRTGAGLAPDHAAYVVYTSGSTGTPKGVVALHRGVVSSVQWYTKELVISSADTVLLTTSYGFDLTQRNIFGPLSVGGRLALAGEPFDPAAVLVQIAAAHITVVNLTPTALQALIEADLAAGTDRLGALRLVLLGGEPAQAAMLLALGSPRPELVNGYGPTECTGVAAYHRLSADLTPYLAASVPLGRPVSNGRLYVLDEWGQPVAVGTAGEVHIGGAGLTRGYLNRRALTAERFVPDPFGGEPGARLYRTGDLARWRPNGELELVGRTDFQVKLRGFRIELEEIEAVLATHAEVRQAVVLARASDGGDPQLVAYFIPPADATVTLDALRAHMADRLPAYMVPAAYVQLDALPLTPNGKLDRKALPAPDDGAYAVQQYEAPVSGVEAALAAIWAEVLRVERVGRHDDFFALGGHSLLAVQVTSRVRACFSVELSIRELFTAPTLQALAHEVERLVYADIALISDAEAEQLLAHYRSPGQPEMAIAANTESSVTQ